MSNRDEVLKTEVTKIIEGMKSPESAIAQILNLFDVGMNKGEALTRLWWQASVDERNSFLLLIEAITAKGVFWVVDVEKDLPEAGDEQ